MCLCVVTENLNPGSMDLEWLRPLKHLWGATEQRYGSSSGTNSPRFCTLSPDQWNSSSLHTLFSRTAATDFRPPPPPIVEKPTIGAALHLLVYMTACTGEDGAGSVRTCVCACVRANCGCSQWPELEVIIMYRLVCCNANANAFSVAPAWVPVLC